MSQINNCEHGQYISIAFDRVCANIMETDFQCMKCGHIKHTIDYNYSEEDN